MLASVGPLLLREPFARTNGNEGVNAGDLGNNSKSLCGGRDFAGLRKPGWRAAAGCGGEFDQCFHKACGHEQIHYEFQETQNLAEEFEFGQWKLEIVQVAHGLLQETFEFRKKIGQVAGTAEDRFRAGAGDSGSADPGTLFEWGSERHMDPVQRRSHAALSGRSRLADQTGSRLARLDQVRARSE